MYIEFIFMYHMVHTCLKFVCVIAKTVLNAKQYFMKLFSKRLYLNNIRLYIYLNIDLFVINIYIFYLN